MKTTNEISSPQNIHTISLFVMNRSGALSRIIMIFARRGYNIESLIVSSALNGHYSRITITAKGDIATLDQIIKQCNKLVDVLHAEEHSRSKSIQKEFAFVKLKLGFHEKSEVEGIAELFNAKVVDETDGFLILEITNSTEELNAMMKQLQKFNLVEIVRTGKILIARGKEKT